ncbi:alpha/beta hydrolase family protein [Williamsia sp.]|uniref:alpha/beta hydrolase n=1 Tax=Williamsia sp. TaxID=1872085 RepID=UPI002F956C8C
MVILCGAQFVAAGPANAEPGEIPPGGTQGAADGSHIVSSAVGPDGVVDVVVHSAAMSSDMAVKVLPAADRSSPVPTTYLLNGAAGGKGGSSWFDRTDITSFFAGEDVNVVVPMGGAASYFTDWRHDDPTLGRQKWATFLTEELPPLMDSEFNGNGRNAIAGISMAGTSVFQLVLRAPDLYRAVGAYSGCAMTSDPEGQAFVRLTVEGRGGGNTVNMWGPPTDPEWVRNDPYVNAEKLRGKAIYLSNGTGLPGEYDVLDGPGINGDVPKLADQVAVGAVIETATNRCSVRMRDRLQQLRIPATIDLGDPGTHSWAYWQDDLHESWPLFRSALAG